MSGRRSIGLPTITGASQHEPLYVESALADCVWPDLQEDSLPRLASGQTVVERLSSYKQTYYAVLLPGSVQVMLRLSRAGEGYVSTLVMYASTEERHPDSATCQVCSDGCTLSYSFYAEEGRTRPAPVLYVTVENTTPPCEFQLQCDIAPAAAWRMEVSKKHAMNPLTRQVRAYDTALPQKRRLSQKDFHSLNLQAIQSWAGGCIYEQRRHSLSLSASRHLDVERRRRELDYAQQGQKLSCMLRSSERAIKRSAVEESEMMSYQANRLQRLWLSRLVVAAAACTWDMLFRVRMERAQKLKALAVTVAQLQKYARRALVRRRFKRMLSNVIRLRRGATAFCRAARTALVVKAHSIVMSTLVQNMVSRRATELSLLFNELLGRVRLLQRAFRRVLQRHRALVRGLLSVFLAPNLVQRYMADKPKKSLAVDKTSKSSHRFQSIPNRSSRSPRQSAWCAAGAKKSVTPTTLPRFVKHFHNQELLPRPVRVLALLEHVAASQRTLLSRREAWSRRPIGPRPVLVELSGLIEVYEHVYEGYFMGEYKGLMFNYTRLMSGCVGQWRLATGHLSAMVIERRSAFTRPGATA